MKSNFAKTIRFDHRIAPKQHQKKVPAIKVVKILNGILILALFTR